MQFKLGSVAVSWDWAHTFILIGGAAAAGATSYLESVPTSDIVSAIGSKTGALALLHGMIVGAVLSLVALAKQTFLVKPTPPAGVTLPKPLTPQHDSTPPTLRRVLARLFTGRRQPPAASPAVVLQNRRGMRLFVPMTLVLGLGVQSAGCTAAQQWWAQVRSNPASAVAQLIRGTQTVIAMADAVMALLEVQLPADQATKAKTAYTEAKTATLDSLTGLENAINAAQKLQEPNPDWTAIENDVQASVQNLLGVVEAFGGKVPMLGAGPGAVPADTTLRHAMASLRASGAVVKNWSAK